MYLKELSLKLCPSLRSATSLCSIFITSCCTQCDPRNCSSYGADGILKPTEFGLFGAGAFDEKGLKQVTNSTLELIHALRVTAKRLENGAPYEWGHMGRCNCGHLVQTITAMSSREIVESVDFAMDEWSEHAKDYCEGTGYKVDDLFLTLQKIGFDYRDVIHLENLTDQRVLRRLGQHLRRNCVTDVVLYLTTLADILEEDNHSTPLYTLLTAGQQQTSEQIASEQSAWAPMSV